MKTIEFFAGQQSFSKVARAYGLATFTTDILPLQGIDVACDVMNFDLDWLPYIPDVGWFSPDCAAWSKAAGKTHFDAKSLMPKTEKAKKAIIIIERVIEIIAYILERNPNFKYYIENPEGRMQKYLQASTLFNQKMRLVVIDQCQYGRAFQKTTHIFTNDVNWKPRRRCPGNPECGHTPNIKSQKVGAKSSLGALDGCRYYQRAAIPQQLIEEILFHQKTIFE